MKFKMEPTLEITAVDIHQVQTIDECITELIDMVDCNDECEDCSFFDVDMGSCKFGQLHYYGREVRRIMEQSYFKEKKEER